MKDRILLLPRRTLLGLGLGLITLALFLPAVRHEFLGYDDQQYVTENLRVRAGLTGANLAWAFRSYYASNWHPLTWVSHMADCQLFGLRAAGHHFTSVALHVLNSLLVFWLFQRLTGALWRSLCLAALFAWHPLHVESVAWIAERKDLLCATFFLLSLWAYAKSVTASFRSPAPPGVWYGLALVSFALALMSKPMAVTLPCVLFLLDFWPLGRTPFAPATADSTGALAAARVPPVSVLRLVLEKIPFFALSAASCLLTLGAQRQGDSVVSLGGLPLVRRLAHVLMAYVHYLSATFWPKGLAVYYPYPAREPTLLVVGAGLLLALLSLAALRVASRRPWLAFGWFWFLGMLVPVIGLVQVGDQAWADRYTYLPLIGLFAALVWGLADLGSPRRLVPVAAVLAVVLLTLSSLQLRYWQDTRTLFTHAAAVTQKNSRALTLLGSLLAAEGKLTAAKDYYQRALSFRPDDPEAHFSLGRALDQEGNVQAALAEYQRALWFKPLQEQAHLFSGIALAKAGRLDEAATHYRAALRLNPDSAAALNNLARLLHSQGRLDEALTQYLAALKLNPNLAQAHNNAGVLLLQQGRVAEGVSELRAALRLQPTDRETQHNLALGLNQQERWPEAAELFARLEPESGQDPNLLCQYGVAVEHLRKPRDAMALYARALLLQPDFPEALNRLSWILATAPQPELRNGAEAVRMAERACELTGRTQSSMLWTLAAAYAEVNRFPDAVATAQAAIQAASRGGAKQETTSYERRLASFQAGKPWRE